MDLNPDKTEKQLLQRELWLKPGSPFENITGRTVCLGDFKVMKALG
jgi:hypothetical protein